MGWFRLVSVGFSWFRLVSVGLGWFQLVSVGFCWFPLVSVGFSRVRLVSIKLSWFQLVSVGFVRFSWFQPDFGGHGFIWEINQLGGLNSERYHFSDSRILVVTVSLVRKGGLVS